MPASIAVVVVNWNGWRDTLLAHLSLLASDEPDWHLYVVDNASSDGSLEELGGLRKSTLIANPRNDGFAGACNIGIRQASQDGCEYVFLLNNDATVLPDTLGTLLRHARSKKDTVLGCTVRFAGSKELQFFGSRRGEDGAPLWLEDPKDAAALEQALIPTDFVFGAALFASARQFREVGLFDERFFLTYEETDWCYRATAIGVNYMIVRDAVVHHQSSKSLGDIASPLQAYFLQRNRLLFLEKNGGFRNLIRGLREARWSIRNATTPSTQGAMHMAIRHYLLRRFGDCPASIRRLAATA